MFHLKNNFQMKIFSDETSIILPWRWLLLTETLANLINKKIHPLNIVFSYEKTISFMLNTNDLLLYAIKYTDRIQNF